MSQVLPHCMCVQHTVTCKTCLGSRSRGWRRVKCTGRRSAPLGARSGCSGSPSSAAAPTLSGSARGGPAAACCASPAPAPHIVLHSCSKHLAQACASTVNMLLRTTVWTVQRVAVPCLQHHVFATRSTQDTQQPIHSACIVTCTGMELLKTS